MMVLKNVPKADNIESTIVLDDDENVDEHTKYWTDLSTCRQKKFFTNAARGDSSKYLLNLERSKLRLTIEIGLISDPERRMKQLCTFCAGKRLIINI